MTSAKIWTVILFGIALIHFADCYVHTSCEDGWVAYEGNCYLIGHSPLKFVEAEHFCRQHHGHVVEPYSSLENMFVKDQLRYHKRVSANADPHTYKLRIRVVHIWDYRRRQLNRSAMEEPLPGETAFLITVFPIPAAQCYWIGGTDETAESTWKWYSTGNMMNFTDWHPGQPGSDSGDEDCLAFWSQVDFKWVDAPCTMTCQPVCKLLGFGDETGEIVG